MDVMRNRIRPILDSLRQWRCRFSEELTEVEIRPGDYHFSEKLDADQLKDGWMPFGACETWGRKGSTFLVQDKGCDTKGMGGKRSTGDPEHGCR